MLPIFKNKPEFQALPYMDQLKLTGLRFKGCHGVLPEEQKNSQEFIVNITLLGNFSNATETDKIEDTVDYRETYMIVKAEVEQKRYQLIETLAVNIAEQLLSSQQMIEKVRVEVCKPSACIQNEKISASAIINREK